MTCVLTLSTLLCFDVLLLRYGRSLCYRYYTFCTHRVHPTFLWYSPMVGHSPSVCGPVLRECIAILSQQFPPFPASNGDWLPVYARPISKGSFISRSFIAELGLSRGFIIRLVVPSTLSVSVYFDLAEILIRHSQRFEHGTRYICYCFYILVFKYSTRCTQFRLVAKAMRHRYVGHVLLV